MKRQILVWITVKLNQNYKYWYLQIFCLTLVLKRQLGAKPPLWVADREEGGSLTRWPQVTLVSPDLGIWENRNAIAIIAGPWKQ